MNEVTLPASDHKLSITEKVGFGLGDTASNILYQAWSFFLAKFYTDVYLLSADTASSSGASVEVTKGLQEIPGKGATTVTTYTVMGKF